MENYEPPSRSAGAKGKAKKAKAKAKDPNAPKGAKGSFLYFSSEMRSTIKEENPDVTGLEMVSQDMLLLVVRFAKAI
jgi:hypothetical protein